MNHGWLLAVNGQRVLERNGTECVPKAENGTLLEPAFGFFKGTD